MREGRQQLLSIFDWEISDRFLSRVVLFRGALERGVDHRLELSFEFGPSDYPEVLSGYLRLSPSYIHYPTGFATLISVGSMGLNCSVECSGWILKADTRTCSFYFTRESEQCELISLLSEQEFVTFKFFCHREERIIEAIPFPNIGGISRFPRLFWQNRPKAMNG
ncbi:MAG: hypothetical protein JJU21_17990 [Salinarimonas sp.]|nr:hypothetical protein [Salinarimonas sp.]